MRVHDTRAHLKAEPHLSLSANTQVILNLREKIEEDKTHFKTLEENLKFQNEDLQNQLYKIKADLPKMIDSVVQPYIDTVNELLERLGAVPQEE